VCSNAKRALSEALSWLEPNVESTFVFRVNRAEPSTRDGNRPDTAFVSQSNNLIVEWPTKLALAPALADQVLPLLDQELKPTTLPQWSKAPEGYYPWV